ncbi:MAG: exodeoxyribonuclease VII small subunit [Campylobacterota bacterium]|nr:exodeoxyribonuclease VII small subunit [Campylobacterota bacterium]
MSNKEDIKFEDKIDEAKELLDKLLDPEITLSQSVEIYKNGLEKLDIAQKLLEDAKLKFEELSLS